MHSRQAKASDNKSGYSPAASSAAESGLQFKLAIGAVNDPLEAEADAMADRVMRMPKTPLVQRKCAQCEEEGERLQRKLLSSQITPFIQAKSSEAQIEASAAVASDIESTRGGGNPLPETTRDFMESCFRADFSDVRIHAGDGAAQLSKNLGARAFTSGRDIFFADGEWSPTTDRGRWLIAHELAHTMQPDGGLVMRRQTSAPTKPKPEKSIPTATESTKKDLHVFIYDTGDKALSPIWEASAKAFATADDGIAVQSGANAAGTLDNIVQALDTNKTKYGCIRSIEFFGHGAAGVTLWGKGELKEADIPAAATKATALTGSHSGPTVTLNKNFSRLRTALCSSSYLHFRTCETFKDPVGQQFASRLAKYLGKSYIIGHTKIIDVNLPGREIYDPKGKKMKPTEKVPEGLLPAKKPASKLPVQNFRIEIDLSGLGKGGAKSLPGGARFVLAGRSTIHLSAQVLDHPDPEMYLLRTLLLAPKIVDLGSLAKVIPTLVPSGTVTGPTVGLIKQEGDALSVPIDRSLIEYIARLRMLDFPYPTDYGIVKITIIGGSKEPSAIERAGGFKLGAGALFTKSVLGTANIQLPLTSFGPSVRGVPVNIFRLHTGVEALLSDKTAIGRANLGLRLDFETLGAEVGVFAGGGLYEGRPDWMVGGGVGLGTKIGNFTVDAGWEMFFTGEGSKEPNHAGFLRLGWRFE